MKIIDLLNKIAKDELEDTKFICDGNYFKYWKHSKQIDMYTSSSYENVKFYNADAFSIDSLNNEVEIFDESISEEIKKLEKPNGYSAENYIEEIFDSVNELIDVVNKQNKCIEEFKKLKEELEK